MSHRYRETFHPSDSRSKPRQRPSKIPDVQGRPPSQPQAWQAEREGWTDHEHQNDAEYRNLGEAFARRPSSRNLANDSPPLQPPSITSEREIDDVSSPAHSRSPERRSGTRFKQPVMTTIDWRKQICQFLQISPESTDDTIIECLDFAAEKLEDAKRITAEESEPQDLTPRYQTIHKVRCEIDRQTNLYVDEPFVVGGGQQSAHLRGTSPIYNFELFLEKNKAISFINYKNYRCCGAPHPRRRQHDKNIGPEPSSLLTGESVSIISSVFCAALKAVANEALYDIPHPEFAENFSEFPSPYLWWYCRRRQILRTLESLSDHAREHIQVFEEYLQDNFGGTWAVVDSLLSEGKISAQYIEYLFKPNTVLVLRSEHERPGQQQAYLCESWLDVEDGDWTPWSGRPRPSNFSGLLDCKSWIFNGTFQKLSERIPIGRLPSMKEPFDICDMDLYPIIYAGTDLTDLIRARGQMFWKCRFKNYVCYDGEFDDIQSHSDPRFMIDYATYKKIHAGETKKNTQRSRDDDLGPEVMARDEPPQEDGFLLCLPKTIPGFNMNKKEWTSLEVSRISDVKWNKAAFDSLVVDKETKELISALVTNQIDAEKSTDLMSGKGNGLFILLHGGPGTGKTLTAESVAEFSQKPLYRVTCGDIGTKAEEVEKYLEVVMLLGKTWGCVVLLDEADVFLERRQISDLQRNALVSVFLRMLEYYDGILILTSNRVGHFDEAFKSRIQLTLRYKTLDKFQRLQIWQNFVTRLEGFQPSEEDTATMKRQSSIHGGVDRGIKVDEVKAKLPLLAEAQLNGREIRNAISTARQLAMFRKEKMGYEHLKVVIAEAKKFEDYLLELNDGFSPDDISKIEKTRL